MGLRDIVLSRVDGMLQVMVERGMAKAHHTPIARKRSLPDAASRDYGRFVQEFGASPVGRSMAAEANTWVMRCINYHVGEISKIKWYVINADGERIEEHPLIQAYRWSWEHYQEDIFSRWVIMKLVHGDVFFEKLDKEGLEGGLRILNSQYVSPQVHNGKVTGFNYIVSDPLNPSIIKPDRIFWDKTENLQSDIRGKSPMDRALTKVNLDVLTQATFRSYLLNDNKPAALMSLKSGVEPPTPDEWEALMEEFREQGEGAEGGWSTRGVPYAVDLQPFATQGPNLDLLEDARREICIEFGLDPAVIGATISKDPLGASGVLAEKKSIALESTIIPSLKHMENFINFVVMPWIDADGGHIFMWDYNRIERLNSQYVLAVQEARKDLHGGVMSPNEYREFRLLPKVKGGDKLFMPKMFDVIDIDGLDEYAEEKEEARQMAPGNADSSPMESDMEAEEDEDEEKSKTSWLPTSAGRHLSDVLVDKKAVLYQDRFVEVDDEDVDAAIEDSDDDEILTALLEADIDDPDQLLSGIGGS